jgi:hypothetical protein
VTSDINHINEGIRLGLTEDREKRSESLGRTAQWKGNASLSSLPAYLTVQIMRFYYKVQAQQRAKIMRKVLLRGSKGKLLFCAFVLLKCIPAGWYSWISWQSFSMFSMFSMQQQRHCLSARSSRFVGAAVAEYIGTILSRLQRLLVPEAQGSIANVSS